MSVSTIQPSHLKKQLRDTERLLKRPNLAADIRREQERKLQHIQFMLVERAEAQRVQALKSKYAKVRFFEGRKSERRLKVASKALIAEPNEETLEAWMEAKRNSTYVHTFPVNQKYISLWPTAPLTGAALIAKRAEIKMTLAKEHGLATTLPLEDAIAIAKAELNVEGPTKLQAKASVPMIQSLKNQAESDNDDDDEDDDNDDNDNSDDNDDAEDDDDEDDDDEDGDDSDDVNDLEDLSDDDEGEDDDEDDDDEDDDDEDEDDDKENDKEDDEDSDSDSDNQDQDDDEDDDSDDITDLDEDVDSDDDDDEGDDDDEDSDNLSDDSEEDKEDEPPKKRQK